MLTFKAETAEQIEAALPKIGILPRKQRARFLKQAQHKLQARRLAGEDVSGLLLRVSRLCAKESRRLRDSRGKVVNKLSSDLQAGEVSKVRTTSRYAGLRVGRDDKGYYVTNPARTKRTKSYEKLSDVTEEELAKIA